MIITYKNMTPIEYFMSQSSFKAQIKKLAKENADDFYQDMCLKIIEGNQQKFNELLERNELGKFFGRIIQNQLKKKQSEYSKLYTRKPDAMLYDAESSLNELDQEELDKIEDTNRMAKIAEDFINSPKNLSEWVQNAIVTRYVEEGSFQKVSDAMQGSKTKDAVKHSVTKFKKRFNAHLEKNNISYKQQDNDKKQ